MYKVAVILNESETERYGVANVVPVLRKSVDHHEYEFDAYTVVNIGDFFHRSSSYDSMFVSYNACNDELLYAKLLANRSAIADFLNTGRGLFVSFQKRLADNNSFSGFLPEEYDYQIMGRKEPSSEGTIVVPSGSEESILLRYPKKISTAEVLHRCRNNEFKDHLYRGLIVPKNSYNFTPIFVDDSYPDHRKILLCSRYDFHARIVISTMPLDWEGHVNLLGNIVTFITEGLPLVAFVGKRGSDTLDYDYLGSSLKFHKIPGKTYKVENLDDPAIRTDVHKFYVFGPGWSEEECADYWGRIHKKDQDCRVYFLKKTSGVPSLVEYSKHSFSDSIILESVAWINSRFKNGRFQSSFWITHDVVEMLTAMSLPLDSIRDDILRRAREHDKDGSYDSLMGATCALIEMYYWLLGRDSQEYRQSLKWIGDNFNLASHYDRQTAILTLAKLGEPYDPEAYRDIYNTLCDITHAARMEISELDLCRNAQFCLLKESDSALDWINILVQLQGAEGMWTNGARTATTVIFLIANRTNLSGAAREVDQMISKGISFLSSEFNKSGVCWDGDTLTTAKATQALKMFQRLLEYPVEEAFLSIRRQQRTISNTQSSLYANLAIEGIRKELAEAKADLSRHKTVVGHYRRIKARFDVFKSIAMLVLVAIGALTLYIFYMDRQYEMMMFIQDFIKDLRITIPAVVVFLIGIWLHVKFIRIEEKRSLDTNRKVDDL